MAHKQPCNLCFRSIYLAQVTKSSAILIKLSFLKGSELEYRSMCQYKQVLTAFFPFSMLLWGNDFGSWQVLWMLGTRDMALLLKTSTSQSNYVPSWQKLAKDTCFRGPLQSAACTSPVLFFYFFFICIQIQYNSQAVRLSQNLAALSRNSTEQGKRDDGDRGPGGNPAEDDVKGSQLLCWPGSLGLWKWQWQTVWWTDWQTHGICFILWQLWHTDLPPATTPTAAPQHPASLSVS